MKNPVPRPRALRARNGLRPYLSLMLAWKFTVRSVKAASVDDSRAYAVADAAVTCGDKRRNKKRRKKKCKRRKKKNTREEEKKIQGKKEKKYIREEGKKRT